MAALFATLFGRLLGRWREAVAAMLGIAIYTVLVGAEAAVVRAALMGGNSLAPGKRQGLPSPETLEVVQSYALLRTDRNGWIELTTDGEGMWVEVERHRINQPPMFA